MTDQKFFELVQARVINRFQDCLNFMIDYADYKIEKDNLDERSMNNMIEDLNCKAEKYIPRINNCHINSIQDIKAMGSQLTTAEFEEILSDLNDECPEKLGHEHYGLGESAYILHTDNQQTVTIATFNLY